VTIRTTGTQEPFGRTDGSRTSLDDFVHIPGITFDPTSERTIRLIIGKKGSGKTLLIRKLSEAHRSRATEDSPLYQLDYEPIDILVIQNILRRLREYVSSLERETSTEGLFSRRMTIISLWETLWRRALTCSVLSVYIDFLRHNQKSKHFFKQFNSLSSSINNLSTLEAFFRKNSSNHVSFPFRAYTPSEYISSFSSSIDSNRALINFINSSRWQYIEQLTSTFSNSLPNVYTYIDSIDRDFEIAPEAWLLCQQGLVRSIVESRLSPRESTYRMHTIVAIRDIAYSRMLRSEHGTRFFSAEDQRTLNWTQDNLRRFINCKVDVFLSGSSSNSVTPVENSFARWLSFSHIENGRKTNESIEQYVIRHSRRIPRDIVLHLNKIFTAQVNCRIGDHDFGITHFMRAVSDGSALIGQEMKEIIVNEMISNPSFLDVSNLTVALGNLEAFDLDARRSVAFAILDGFVNHIGKEVFDQQELDEAVTYLENMYQVTIRSRDPYFSIENILWRHGMIGVEVRRAGSHVWMFSGDVESEVESAPSGRIRYGFHASVFELYVVSREPNVIVGQVDDDVARA
jgi:hypothetical protein